MKMGYLCNPLLLNPIFLICNATFQKVFQCDDGTKLKSDYLSNSSFPFLHNFNLSVFDIADL